MLRNRSPVSTPPRPTQRARMAYVWPRILSATRPFAPLRIEETPNPKILQSVVEMWRDDPDVARVHDKLSQYAESMRQDHGVRVVRYAQKSLAEHILPEHGYDGCKMIGRAYTNNEPNWMPRKILNTLYKTTHVELDLVTSYSSMLVNAFRDVDLPALKGYVDEPRTVYAGFLQDVGLSEKDVKKMLNAMICSHPSTAGDLGIGYDRVDDVRSFLEHDFTKALRKDLDAMSASLRDNYGPFYEVVKNRCRVLGKLPHVDGVALSFLAADMEHAVMRSVIEKLGGGSLSDMVWLFDGVLVPMHIVSGASEDVFCQDLRAFVKEKWDLDVAFKLKGLWGNSLAIALPDVELEEASAYQQWKVEFEKRFFRLETPAIYCMEHSDGLLQDLNDVQFSHNTMEQPQPFIKQWKADPAKRMYKRKDFAPPPLPLIPGYFNVYKGLPAEKWDDVDTTGVDLDPYLTHVRLLMGDREDHASYFHRLIALKIQQPGVIWRVMPFIRSTPGVGKDLWFLFIESILGKAHTVRVSRVGEVMDKCSHLLEGALLVCISEAEFADSARHMDYLKNAITSDELVVKKKYVNEYRIRSSACFIAFSNNFGAFQIPVDDRRFFCVTASGRYANDPAYHQPLIAYLDKLETKKAVYDYYMGMDIEGFDPSGERPVTETFKEMTVASQNTFDLLLKKAFPIWRQQAAHDVSGAMYRETGGILRLSAKVVWDDFQIMAQEMAVVNADSRHKMVQFGTRLLSETNARIEKFKTIDAMSSVIIKYYSNNKRFYKMDILAIERYLEECLGERMDEEDHEDNGYAVGFTP